MSPTKHIQDCYVAVGVDLSDLPYTPEMKVLLQLVNKLGEFTEEKLYHALVELKKRDSLPPNAGRSTNYALQSLLPLRDHELDVFVRDRKEELHPQGWDPIAGVIAMSRSIDKIIVAKVHEMLKNGKDQT